MTADLPPLLSLHGRDVGDIAVLASLLQDALVNPADCRYEQSDNSFLMVVNRFCWEEPNAPETKTAPPFYRVIAGLKITQVEQVQHQGFIGGDYENGFHNLLSLHFEPTHEGGPSGWLIFTFSNHVSLRLNIAEVSLVLSDLAAPYPTSKRPDHPLKG